MALILEESVVDYQPESPLAPEPNPGQPRSPTELARRYGVSDHRIFKNTGKSSITPILPPLSELPIPYSPNTLRRGRIHEELQRNILSSFATWELKDSGCWMDQDAKPCELDQVQIHPLYQKSQWLDGNIPVGDGLNDGVWEGQNPVVWNLLQPCLKLATLFLEGSQNSHWIDALLFGSRQEVPRDEIASAPLQPDMKDYSFHTRSVEEFMNGLGSQSHYINQLLPIMRIAIASSRTSTKCVVIPGQDPWNIGGVGFAVSATTHGTLPFPGSSNLFVFTTLHLEILQPLMRDALTSSERLAQQIQVAVVLVHETMHALGIMLRGHEPRWMGVEPFFEDEEVAELGFSWEKSCFSLGRICPLVGTREDGFNTPVLSMYIDSWPQWWEFHFAAHDPFNSQRKRRSDRFDFGASTDIWPFHMAFLESIAQHTYWTTCVKNFATDAIVPPRILGRRSVSSTGPDRSEVVTIYGPDYHRWISPTRKHEAPPPVPFVASEAEKWEGEQRLLIRSSALNVFARKVEQDEIMYQRSTKLVQAWETRRRNNPLPIAVTKDVRLARLNIALRNAEIEETAATIEVQHKTSDELAEMKEEIVQRVRTVQEMLEDIIELLHNGNSTGAFEYCDAVMKMLTQRTPLERFLIARTHVLLGMQGIMRARDHLHAAIGIYRSFQVMEVPPIDGKWQTWIDEAQEVLEQFDDTKLKIAKREFETEQTSIDNAIEAVWMYDQKKAASICVGLLQSNFMPIRAQAHLLLARLPKTVDKTLHAKQAQYRLQKLIEHHPEVRDWGSMLTAAVWVLNPPPPWIVLEDLDDREQQVWLDHASRLLAGGNLMPASGMNQVEGLKIYLTFTQSAYLAIRAQCHHKLAGINFAADDLFRRLEAFQALEDIQRMRIRNPNDPAWLARLLNIQNILGGSTRSDWELASTIAGRTRTMERLVRSFARLGRPLSGLNVAP